MENLHSANQVAIDELNKKTDSQRNVLAYRRKKIQNLPALNIIGHTPNAVFQAQNLKND